MRMWEIMLWSRCFELIGLKIMFDVDRRHVGKTPSWDMDILSPGLGSKKWCWNSVYLPR